MSRSPVIRIVPVLALLAAFGAAAQSLPMTQPQGVLNLTANASIEVAKDTMSIAFTVSRDGSDAAAVQAQLKQALDAALAEARKVARPGQVEVQTGMFSMSPRYGVKGGLAGWQGTAELLVEGRDMPAIAQLAGRVTTMTIGRVGYTISRELREKVEQEAAARAIASFRAKAAATTKQFGYADYTIREVSVSTNDPGPIVYAAAMRPAMAMAKVADEALPVEAGQGTVTASVGGSIQMK